MEHYLINPVPRRAKPPVRRAATTLVSRVPSYEHLRRLPWMPKVLAEGDRIKAAREAGMQLEWFKRQRRLGKKARLARLRAAKSGIRTPLSKHKTKKENTPMNPLMLINPKRRKSARKSRKGKMPAHLRKYAFKKKATSHRRVKRAAHRRVEAIAPVFAMSNPKRRTVRRAHKAVRRHHNPKRSMKSFLSFKRGSAPMEIVTMTAYAFSGGLLSTVGLNYATKFLPASPMLQTPLARITMKVALAAGLYQLHRFSFVGRKNAIALSAGAALPVVNDLVGLVGMSNLLPAPSTQSMLPAPAPKGVGLLPRAYQGGTLSMIMPKQNMAGGGEEGW